MLVMETKFNILGCLDIEMKKHPSNLHKIKTLKNEFFYKWPLWFIINGGLMLILTVLVESILISDTILLYYIYIYTHNLIFFYIPPILLN